MHALQDGVCDVMKPSPSAAAARCFPGKEADARVPRPGIGPSPNDAFLGASNTYYAEEMYRLWKEDPSQVHPSWNVYFSGLSKGIRSEDAFRPAPSLLDLETMGAPGNASSEMSLSEGTDVQDHMKVRRFRLSFAGALLLGSRAR